jgi:hypothetical protein
MNTKKCLDAAAALRRDARRAWFLASGPCELHAQLIAAAVALERAAGEIARAENNTQYNHGLRAHQRGA